MNPGLVVKLRPSGPWRIGPDSGARNRVDVIYHSDSLFSAVASAMTRLGGLDEWLDATARNGEPAVCFSSCFPFLDEIELVVPPRTIWPPTSPALRLARVRWKSARFVPLEVVRAVLAGQALDENRWSIDGASECLVPAGHPGPFRTGVHWSAAVDRLSGATERHSTACIEFRPGSGLWAVVSFRDEAAHARWIGPVKAAFRLLADTGFGGERSRGWGRSEPPEFVEGSLPEMILGIREAAGQETAPPIEPPCAVVVAERPVAESPVSESPITDAESTAAAVAAMESESPAPGPAAPEPDPPVEPVPEPAPPDVDFAPAPEPAAEQSAGQTAEQPAEPPSQAPGQSHWLLSLFIPAPVDAVDWRRGNYAVLARGGRVDSPAGSGELKKQVHMVTEGSVLHAGVAPRGTAADVAPDGFAHPVFRAGFALSVPLPEVR